MSNAVFHVVELADVVLRPGDGRPGPAEEAVRERLHDPLAGHDPLALVAMAAAADVRRQDRFAGLLDLEDERTAGRSDEHRHVAARPDAADPDDLERDVDQPMLLDEHPAVLPERADVAPVEVRQRRSARVVIGQRGR